jgi:hypothetical protein
VNTEAIVFAVLDIAIRVLVPCILMRSYQEKIDEIGYGPNAIPEYLFEHREHGWDGEVQLRVCEVHETGTRVKILI